MQNQSLVRTLDHTVRAKGGSDASGALVLNGARCLDGVRRLTDACRSSAVLERGYPPPLKSRRACLCRMRSRLYAFRVWPPTELTSALPRRVRQTAVCYFCSTAFQNSGTVGETTSGDLRRPASGSLFLISVATISATSRKA